MLILAGGMLLVVAGGLTLSRQEEAGTQWLTFVSDRAGNWDIYLARADGSMVHQLTDSPADEWNPAPSSDGRQLAYLSDRNSRLGIVVLDIVSGEEEVLTGRTHDEFFPVWSPDDRRLAFYSLRENFDREIFWVNRDGSGLRYYGLNLTDDDSPAWSPDGRWLAFTRDPHIRGDPNIFRLSTGERDIDQLTDLPGQERFPQWSPDGEWLLFVSVTEGNSDIYRLHLPSRELEQLTNHPLSDNYPTYSPDGQAIVFVSNRDGTATIYHMQADGSQPQAIAPTDPNPSEAAAISWSPDGRWLAYAFTQNEQRDIYRVRPDGSDRQRLTNWPGDDFNPVWSPFIIDLSWQGSVLLAVGLIGLSLGLATPLIFRRISASFSK
jgi:TolB protein